MILINIGNNENTNYPDYNIYIIVKKIFLRYLSIYDLNYILYLIKSHRTNQTSFFI